MAFTDTQKADIRHYLGYPDVFRGSNVRLESAMDVIGERAEVQAKTVAILAEIAAARDFLLPSSPGSLLKRGGLQQVDEIKFLGSSTDGNVSASEMRKAGMQFVNELSIVVGVPVAHNIFGRNGYQDDSWAGASGQSSALILG